MRALWLRRVGFALGLALALGYLPYRVYRKSGLRQYVELSLELKQLQKHNDELRIEARRLRAELEGFGRAGESRDKSAELPLSVVERAARDELGLVRPGEIVFQVVQGAPR
ncbi:MAG: septum formation initiator family protein [Polyangia bacterium]